MQAASATSAISPVFVKSDSEEEVQQLVTHRRARPRDLGLDAKDIRLKTQPSAWPAPERPAPPVPTAGKPALQAGDIAL